MGKHKSCLQAATFEKKDCKTDDQAYVKCLDSVGAENTKLQWCPFTWFEEVENTTIPDQIAWFRQNCFEKQSGNALEIARLSIGTKAGVCSIPWQFDPYDAVNG